MNAIESAETPSCTVLPALPALDDCLRAYPEAIQHPPIKGYIRDCDEGLKLTRKP